jgi:hypothetical protein
VTDKVIKFSLESQETNSALSKLQNKQFKLVFDLYSFSVFALQINVLAQQFTSTNSLWPHSVLQEILMRASGAYKKLIVAIIKISKRIGILEWTDQ